MIRGNNRGKLIGANGIAKRGTREERKGVKARLQSLHSLEFVQSIGRYIYRSRDYYVERLVQRLDDLDMIRKMRRYFDSQDRRTKSLQIS